MNLATLVQSQTLATMLQALQQAGELVPGKTVEATLLSLDAEGLATAQVGEAKIALVLAGPQARQADLQPGTTLVIRIEAPEEPGSPLRATLVETRAAPTAAIPVAPGQPAVPTSQIQTQPLPIQQPQAVPRDTTPNTPPQASGSQMLQPATAATLPGIALQAAPRTDVAAPVPVASAAPASPNPPASPAPAASPRIAAGPLLGPALARQDSLAPLLANLRSVAEGSVALVLPSPLLGLIDRVLSQSVLADRRPITPEVLKQAVQRSGLFLEARQEAGQPPQQGDLKASLTALRDALAPLVERLTPELAAKATLSKAEAATPQRADDQPASPRTPPPRRDGALTPQPAAEPSLTPGEKPLVVAETLLEQADAALDRITLSQYASLPLDTGRADSGQGPRWLTELPFAFQQGTAMVPLQIEREPPRRGPAGVEAPLWRLRFALDVEPMGPLQGVVTLQGRNVGVTLWAEREETSRLLRGATPGLEAALVQAEFESSAVEIHTGQPRVMQPTAGQFLDRMS